MFQCATEQVTILLQRARRKGPEELGPDAGARALRHRSGAGADFIALRGDPSDGLPGAKGIGAKTAADMLQRKGDLEQHPRRDPREAGGAQALIEQADELRCSGTSRRCGSVPLEPPPDTRDGLRGRRRAAEKLGMGRLARAPRDAA